VAHGSSDGGVDRADRADRVVGPVADGAGRVPPTGADRRRAGEAPRLVVRGAREHNLRGVDLDLPRDSIVVFTGLSGSGKSSLAFDTIFAEGQRRYVESLSAYARQFLGQMDKPDVDFIEGLSPAVSIDQKSTNRNPRSTVGTITEVYDYLRLLYARAGVPHCPVCGHVIESRPRSRSSTRCSRWTRAPGSRSSRRWSAPARASSPTCSRSCRTRATPACWSTARCTSWPTRPS
jgi:hypothetical protein